MSEQEKTAFIQEYLVDTLLDMVIVTAKLAQSINRDIMDNQEGGNQDEQNERNGCNYQGATGCCFFH